MLKFHYLVSWRLCRLISMISLFILFLIFCASTSIKLIFISGVICIFVLFLNFIVVINFFPVKLFFSFEPGFLQESLLLLLVHRVEILFSILRIHELDGTCKIRISFKLEFRDLVIRFFVEFLLLFFELLDVVFKPVGGCLFFLFRCFLIIWFEFSIRYLFQPIFIWCAIKLFITILWFVFEFKINWFFILINNFLLFFKLLFNIYFSNFALNLVEYLFLFILLFFRFFWLFFFIYFKSIYQALPHIFIYFWKFLLLLLLILFFKFFHQLLLLLLIFLFNWFIFKYNISFDFGLFWFWIIFIFP